MYFTTKTSKHFSWAPQGSGITKYITKTSANHVQNHSNQMKYLIPLHLSSKGYIRYINILIWLPQFRVKIIDILSFFCPSIPKRDLDTKKTTPNIEVCLVVLDCGFQFTSSFCFLIVSTAGSAYWGSLEGSSPVLRPWDFYEKKIVLPLKPCP